MARFVMLIRYTEIGISQIHRTVSRAEQFRTDAAALGVSIESVYWTMGEFDGNSMRTPATVISIIRPSATVHRVLWCGNLRGG